MIKSAFDIPALGNMNWYGEKRIDLMDVFGNPHYEQDDCIIYTRSNKTITAHLKDDQVDWYKYVCLNNDIDLDKEIPGILLDF